MLAVPRARGRASRAMLAGMKHEASEIRRRLDELPVHGGKRQYTAGARRAVVEFVAQRVAAGATEAAASKEIGMHQATITKWRNGPTRGGTKKKGHVSKRIIPVEVSPVESNGLTLSLPGGLRVEGLVLADVVELAKALR